LPHTIYIYIYYIPYAIYIDKKTVGWGQPNNLQRVAIKHTQTVEDAGCWKFGHCSVACPVLKEGNRCPVPTQKSCNHAEGGGTYPVGLPASWLVTQRLLSKFITKGTSFSDIFGSKQN
jgi:hypothetical protein